MMTSGKASPDLDAVRRIREMVDVPLVVHGGTSLTPATLRKWWSSAWPRSILGRF